MIRLTELIEPAEDFAAWKKPLVTILNHVDDKLDEINKSIIRLDEFTRTEHERQHRIEMQVLARIEALEQERKSREDRWTVVAGRVLDIVTRLAVVAVGLWLAARYGA